MAPERDSPIDTQRGADFWLAPERDSPIDTQRGADAWLQGGPLGLARAGRNRQGPRLRLGLCLLWRGLRGEILPIDAHRGRITGPIPLVEVQGLIGPYGPGRAHLHRARVREPGSAPPYRVISQGARRDGLAQPQRRILASKQLFQTGLGTAATQGIEHPPEDKGAWIAGHLGWPDLLARLDEANLVRLGFHNGQMLDVVRFDRRQHAPHAALPRRRCWEYLLSCDNHRTQLGGLGVRKISLGNYVNRHPRGGGMCMVSSEDAQQTFHDT